MGDRPVQDDEAADVSRPREQAMDDADRRRLRRYGYAAYVRSRSRGADESGSDPAIGEEDVAPDGAREEPPSPPFDSEDLGQLGSALGFDVVAMDLWRSNGWCVVPQELPPTLPVTNTLPERIARLRSDGALTDSDEILGLYLYRESSTATRDLFDRLVTIRRQPTRLRPLRRDLLVSLAEQVLAGDTSHEEAVVILFSDRVINAGVGTV